jgi:hypothetical protein
MSWAVARPAGITRFLRPLDSSLLCSNMWLEISDVMPALACHTSCVPQAKFADCNICSSCFGIVARAKGLGHLWCSN